MLSAYYASEERVLAGGGADPEVIAEPKGIAEKLGGSRPEYIKYLNRDDVRGPWDWCADGAEKATCSCKAVVKRDGLHLRKSCPCC